MGRQRDGKRNRRQAGQTLVEFSLVVVVLVLILLGIIDFSRLFYTYGVMANAAREGARYGTVHPEWLLAMDNSDPDNVLYRTRAMLYLLEPVVEGDPFIEISFPDGCQTSGCSILVEVTKIMDEWTPLIPAFSMTARSVMYIE